MGQSALVKGLHSSPSTIKIQRSGVSRGVLLVAVNHPPAGPARLSSERVKMLGPFNKLHSSQHLGYKILREIAILVR